MKKFFTLMFASAIISIGGINAQSHEKCAAHTLHEKAKQNDPSIALREAAFEAFQLKEKNGGITSKGVVITIPVVFHIIHNGEPVGTGANVSDALVAYQLKRINDDFRKLNTDILPSNHPFFGVQADCEIEFCLATIDTNGVATSGIIRHQMSASSYSILEIDSQIKPATIWDRYSYVNFWCVKIVDPSAPGVDGYATFPTSTTDSTDGVVVDTDSFGYYNGTEKSITATHELGHFFNLIHIWGDATCGDDMVSDTPPAEQSNSGCPTFPYNVGSTCNPGANGEMFMNYMDYSDAACVVMFTTGQKNRALSAITQFRSSLTTSNGCQSTQGIEEMTANNFSVYPNPTNGNVVLDATVQNGTNVTISLYNQVGMLVKQFDQVNSFPQTLNVSEFPAGIYSIVVNSNEYKVTKKVVVAK